MPRKRTHARESPVKKVTRTSRPARRDENEDRDAIPDIYQEMLQDAATLPAAPLNDFSRVSKRRKMSEDRAHFGHNEQYLEAENSLLNGSSAPKTESPRTQQTVYDDFPESDESDAEFEDVQLEPVTEPVLETGEAEDDDSKPKSLQLDFSESVKTGPKVTVPRRKPIGKAERDLRLDVHKWHVLCLLLHLECRNRWCESDEVQASLKPLVSRKTISLLHVDESQPQYQRSHSFNKGIEEICVVWKREWRTTERGMRRAIWRDDLDLVKEADESEDLIDFDDFKEAANSRSGSRDLGAQLFCALLRSVAVETRLVCSLQPLPFSGVAKGQTPEKPRQTYIQAPVQSYERATDIPDMTASPSNPRWRSSEYSTSSPTWSQTTRSAPIKKIQDSPYPIFWVEVFSPASTAWIPLDPLVRNTINKPKTGFEPPASDSLNNMTYVIAFEDDGTAKDVTRRYTQFYNAKTRKLRVESTRGGDKWWETTMRRYHKPAFLWEDRDIIEDAELTRREASEPMPRNVQDFKGHPIYVLERHLRMNEVLHPVHEVGKVNTGLAKGKDGKLESVYRRRDVHVVRSADQWYRRGRDVKVGEVGLKRAKSRAARETSQSDADDSDSGAMLYAEFQTDVYVPPPVVKGKMPKNAYRNIDVYVPTMIPAGAIHFQHPEAAKAAKLLGIDYADAVTGFDFKGRQGTAVINGITVAVEYRDAMVEVVEAMEYERVRAEEESKSILMLQLWKRFMTALRIRKKVDEDYVEQEAEAASGEDDDEEDETYQVDEDKAGGGFVPEAMDHDDADVHSVGLAPIPELLAPPKESTYHEIVIVESPHQMPGAEPFQGLEAEMADVDASIDGEQEPGGFLFGDEDENEFEHPLDTKTASPILISNDEGGGFIPDSPSNAEAGGFLVDEDVPEQAMSADHNTTTASRSLPLQEGQQKDTTTAADVSISDLAQPAEKAPSNIKTDASHPPLLRRDSTKDSFLEITNDDATSLQSHDPEDDDAEPDWLADSD